MELNRQVEPLDEYNEEKHLKTIKTGDIESYENEYHLIKQNLGLPIKFMELPALEQKMVLLFVDNEYIEPESGKHTKNDSFISFLAAYHNKTVIRKIFMERKKVIGYDKEGNEIVEIYTIPNPNEMSLYIKLKTHATMIWKKSNLKEISKSMNEIVTNSGFKDNELLEKKIISDALSNERDSFTMQNRRLSVDILGLKKPMGLQQINVYLEGGGKKANEIIVEQTGNKAFELEPQEVERVNE